jgi:hypothetical protein
MTTRRKSGAAPATLTLPATTDLAAIEAAEIEVIRLAAERQLSTREALDFARMLEYRRRVAADRDLERTMQELEEDPLPGEGGS